MISALAAGNACVVKPSELAPSSAKIMESIIQRMDQRAVFWPTFEVRGQELVFVFETRVWGFYVKYGTMLSLLCFCGVFWGEERLVGFIEDWKYG